MSQDKQEETHYHYDYAKKCDCSDDDNCGCSYPNNLSHDFSNASDKKANSNGSDSNQK